jgi:putative transposase
MTILTYKYRIKDKSARKALERHAFAVNQVWNYCNAVQRDVEDRYQAGSARRRWPSNYDLVVRTSGVTAELGISSYTIGEICRHFSQSRNAAKGSLRFRASGGPRRALGWIPFRRPRLQDNAIHYCGKTYRVFGTNRRPIPSDVKTGAFVQDAMGRWYLTLQFEVAEDLAAGDQSIGIDLGLKTLATCSNGETVPALQHYRKYEAALRIAQRAGNKRRTKAIHAKIANARRDQLHKASTKIARENSLIVVGNVNAAQLKQTRMAKSVSDASWSMFRNQLCYKASRHNAVFVEADERFTSQLCSECGSISGPKGIAQLGIRRWDCSECGASHDRDVNAARNILRVGQSTLPHADGSRAYRISATQGRGGKRHDITYDSIIGTGGQILLAQCGIQYPRR